MEQDKYGLRGVSSQKEEVHKAISKMDKGLFPTAFCKILPDLAAGDPDYCNVMHADTQIEYTIGEGNLFTDESPADNLLFDFIQRKYFFRYAVACSHPKFFYCNTVTISGR